MNAERLLAKPMVSRSWPLIARYASTLAVVGIAVALNYWVWPTLDGYPFLAFMAAIVVAALVFDRGSGFLAIAVGGFATAYLFVEPVGYLAVSRERDLFALFLFVVLGIGVATVIEVMHLSVHRLHALSQELRRSDSEKDLLLQEAAHRTRNDLAILASLVDIQRRSAEEPAASDALVSIRDRIRILLRVQERLTVARQKAVVDTNDFIVTLCDDLKAYFLGIRPIVVSVQAESHHVSQSRAVAVGLIINELLTNVLKYAFPDDRPGTVTVRFAREDDEYRLTIADDGVGLPHELETSGLGQRLVRSMAAQLGGSAEVRSNDGRGATATVTFPAADPA